MIIDSIMVDYLEVGDFVVVDGDHIEITAVTGHMDMVYIKGYSNDTGDEVTYTLPFDKYLDIWSNDD